MDQSISFMNILVRQVLPHLSVFATSRISQFYLLTWIPEGAVP